MADSDSAGRDYLERVIARSSAAMWHAEDDRSYSPGALTDDDLRVLRSLVGETPELDVLNADEHVRYSLFRVALAATLLSGDDSAESAVIEMVLADPDMAMGGSTLVVLMEFAAEAHPGAEAFAAWSEKRGHAMACDDFRARRLAEWNLVKGLAAGVNLDRDAVLDATDWCQRNLSSTSTRLDVLDLLAESGRTKRVRRDAAECLRYLTR